MFKILISLLIGLTPAHAQQTVGSFDQISSHDAYKNFIINTGAEKNVSNITQSASITTRTTTTPLEGAASFSIDATSSGQTVKFTASTLSDYLKGQNCEAKFVFSGDATLYKAYVEQSSNKLTADLQLTNETNTRTVSINFPCGTTVTDVRPVIESTSASAAAIKVDKVYLGLATNIGNIAQAEVVAKFSRITTDQAIGAATETKIQYNGEEYDPFGWYDNVTNYRLTVQKPGKYLVHTTQSVGLVASEIFYNRIKKNGTVVCAAYNQTSVSYMNIHYPACYVDMVSGDYLEFFIQSAADTSYNLEQSSGVTVTRFPATSEQVLSISNPYSPTVQKFTSGSGTYNTPKGVKYLKVRMVGGGGGGGGGNNTGSATSGGNTTFGTSLLTASGATGGTGGGSNGAGGAGGSFTVNSPAINVGSISGMQGANGGHYWNNSGSGTTPGGLGGISVFSGAGSSGYAAAGNNALANSGSGGGGGGSNITAANNQTGGGGGAGGYIEAIIPSPSATYSYAVGSGGAGQAGATNGYAGSAGGSGVIIVEEYYGVENTPLLVGSVSSNSSGAMRVESATVSPTSGASCTFINESSSWFTTTPNGTGDCTLNFTSGLFTSIPVCTVTVAEGSINADNYMGKIASQSTSSVRVLVTARSAAGGSGSAFNGNAFNIVCMGKR